MCLPSVQEGSEDEEERHLHGVGREAGGGLLKSYCQTSDIVYQRSQSNLTCTVYGRLSLLRFNKGLNLERGCH